MKDQTPTTPSTKKATYIAPEITVLSVRVEDGYQCSGTRTLFGGSEGMTDNGGIYFPNGDPAWDGNGSEPMGDGGHLFF